VSFNQPKSEFFLKTSARGAWLRQKACQGSARGFVQETASGNLCGFEKNVSLKENADNGAPTPDTTRGLVPQAQAAQQRLKHASVPQSYGQVPNSSKVYRREGHLFFVPMKLVVFTTLFSSCAECFFSCCDRVAWPQAAVWAPAWAPRPSTCEA
jgi:hypothetical protein